MVQSLERAFAILDEVAQRPAGVTSIAERVRLPKSTVARLLATLEEVDAVERFDGARWRIGPGVAALSFAVTPERSLISIARPFLADLVAELGEDAGLGLPDGNEILYVDQVESDNPVQVRDWTGARAPMHAVPSGLVLLAEWPEDALAQVGPDHQTAVVVLTHDDKFDEPALIGALRTDAFYIGALGSRRNQERRRERLLDAGVTEEEIARINGPCGLDIGADSPEETALSILAEILAVRARRAGGQLRESPQRIHAEVD